MLESDYSLALSINLSGIPSQIQRGASERCLLFRDDILPISCTRNERVFLISPCNTHRSCCVSPFGTAVALLLSAGFEKGLWVGIIGAASDYTSLFLERLLIRIFEIENSCMIYKKFSAGKNLSVGSSQSLLNNNKQTALCLNTNSITKTQQKNERARNCTAD